MAKTFRELHHTAVMNAEKQDKNPSSNSNTLESEGRTQLDYIQGKNQQ